MDSQEAQLQASLLAALAPFADHLALLVRNNQLADIAPLLTRPDAQAVLAKGIGGAATQAADALDAAWHAAGPQQASGYAAALATDVQSIYAGAAGQLSRAATAAFHSVPQRTFTVGVSVPGTNPVVETAEARAQAVHSALTGAIAGLSTRAVLSASVAATRSRTEAVLAEGEEREAAGEVVWKEWVSRWPEPGVCHWCRQLHGVRVRLHDSFPHGEPAAFPHARTRRVATAVGMRRYHMGTGSPIILTHPPRVYRDLLGPPRHPRCRCRIRLVAAGTPAPPEPEPSAAVPHLISSADIRDMPADRYNLLIAFIRAALHELGQVLERLVHGR